ncbi:MAG TPA: TonB family protein [Caulobacteraceae bacterium]|jgi:protein TonB
MNVLGPAAAVLLLAAPAPEAPKVSSTFAGHHPHWVRRPNGTDFTNNYPSAALRSGLSGHATMECSVKPDGNLETCKVTEETPPGHGFGDATLHLMSKFRMGDGAGIAAGAKVVIPIAWKVGG